MSGPNDKLSKQNGAAAKPDARRRPGRRRMRPQTRARISFGIFIAILLTALVIWAGAMLRRGARRLPNDGGASNLVVEGGEAQLLENFTRPALLPERIATVRLDGVMMVQQGENYATFTVDGITATMVVNDYLGSYQITEISANGVELNSPGETVVLTLSNNRLDIANREEGTP